MKAVARRNKLTYRWVPERGSGSHGTLYVGDRFTVVKDLKKELGPGLLSDMH
jgi:mRNA interferase HicA